MIDVFRQPRSPQEAQDLVNPARKVELRKVCESNALIATGIPLAADFKERYSLPDLEFDVIDLALNDILDKNYAGENRENFEKGGFGALDYMTSLLRVVASEANPSVSTQHLQLTTEIFRMVFAAGNQEGKLLLNDFLANLKRGKDKPFLILIGHGGPAIDSLGHTFWSIGEKDGSNTSNIQDILKSQNLNKYSAVLILACNKGELEIEKETSVMTPIYFSKGIVSLADIKQTPHKI